MYAACPSPARAPMVRPGAGHWGWSDLRIEATGFRLASPSATGLDVGASRRDLLPGGESGLGPARHAQTTPATARPLLKPDVSNVTEMFLYAPRFLMVC